MWLAATIILAFVVVVLIHGITTASASRPGIQLCNCE